jgi:ABC-type polysaccharide/polyol phosphate transport system ATPase subunit
MPRIDLDHVSLKFQVRPNGRISLKEFVLKHLFRRSRNPVIKVNALRDLDLHFREGDRVGILGHNGAGKSTLLKLLAGIYPPTRGRRVVQGRISSLFDIALGFEPDANGWENIAFRSYLQGETPTSIRGKLHEIAAFSELGDFLNMPIRYYSAGMMVRLAFSISTAIEPEILLVDEVLSVGDLAFHNKARQRMREMMAKARLIVLVSHDLSAVSQLCEQVVWLEQGRVRQVGPASEVVTAYQRFMQAKDRPDSAAIARRSVSVRAALPGDGSQRACWQFERLDPGRYDVQVTWTPDSQQATDAPYSIFDGPHLLTKQRVNQQLDPFGTTTDGRVFQSLGHFDIRTGVVRVELTNEANSRVVADSVRVLAVPPEGLRVVDDGQPGYQEAGGGWTGHWNSGGYGNRFSYALPGDGSQTATWTVDGLPPGEYDLEVTWTPHPSRATNAPYTVCDGATPLGTVRLNQRHPPVGTAVNGVIFQSLGRYPVGSGTLRVVLSNDTDDLVVADAVHVRAVAAGNPLLLSLDQPGYSEFGPRWAA